MSWDVCLNDKEGMPVTVERHEEGGTYVFGGTSEAELNITYNYSPFYFEHLNNGEGLRWLNGKTARETLKALQKAVACLGIEQCEDYWEASPGNAGFALSILAKWAEEHPDGIWEVN